MFNSYFFLLSTVKEHQEQEQEQEKEQECLHDGGVLSTWVQMMAEVQTRAGGNFKLGETVLSHITVD